MKLVKILTLASALTSFTLAEDTPLAESMSDANTSYKLIRRNMDGTWEEKLEWATNMATAFTASADYLPEGLEDPKMIALYKEMIYQNLSDMYELKRAALEQDQEAFEAAYAKIKETKSQGHDTFIED